MHTGIGVGGGAVLLALAYAIQFFGFLPDLVRMRVVAFMVMVGMASAIVPTKLGTWSYSLLKWLVGWLGAFAGNAGQGWAYFVTALTLPLISTVLSLLWLAYFLPRFAAIIFGPVATNQFDDGDYLMVWGAPFLIALLWSSSLGTLGDIGHVPIQTLVHGGAPAIGHIIGSH